MKERFLTWLDHRTGYRRIVDEALFKNIPGGAKWRHVWGSTLTFCFVTQVITGIFLWMGYSPSAQTAWESVYYIQHEMAGGWFLRGIHHYTAQIFPVLLVMHLLQVVIYGAYKAPKEFNFWLGILLAILIVTLARTGYLLPWDQEAYWGTRVVTSIVAQAPLVGPEIERLAVGGTDFGHHTLTRFFALHAGLLPAIIGLLLVVHLRLCRRNARHESEASQKPGCAYWPDQAWRNAIAGMFVLGAVVLLVLYHHGAKLGAPADPSESFQAARPDWYFLFLFQTLKSLSGLWGAFVLPGCLVGMLVLMPLTGRLKKGHVFNVGFLFVALTAMAVLTYLALDKDWHDEAHKLAVNKAQANSERVKILAESPKGIPVTGAVTLLREDPLTQGPRLFAKHCASCHRYDGHNGMMGKPIEKAATASDLKGFANRSWLKGLFDPEQVSTLKYFGGTKFRNGKMAKWVKKNVPKFDDSEKEMLSNITVALSAEAQLKRQRDIDARHAAVIAEGQGYVAEIGCTDCHQYREPDEDATAPDLTGYGSREWLIGIISNPEHDRFYGSKNDRMPAYGRDEKLTPKKIKLLSDWLREDWYEKGDELKPEPKPAKVDPEPEVVEPEPKPAEPSEPEPKPAEPSEPEPEPAEPSEPDPEPEPSEPDPEPEPTEPDPVPSEAEPGDGPDPERKDPPKLTVDFVTQIKPVFESRCVRCHNAEKKKGKYLMGTKLVACKTGESELPPIVPGKPDESNLVKLISLDEDHDDIMPSKGGPLTKEQIQAIRTWIAEGAHWPEGLVLKAVKKK
jgi:ubiquinol-cytochrome c reductase cytochrome b subunit